MAAPRISSLSELEAWTPDGRPKPIVLEWFLPWFFDGLLMKDKLDEAWMAVRALTEFAVRCEGLTQQKARDRVWGNLDYYSGYSTRWNLALERMKRNEK